MDKQHLRRLQDKVNKLLQASSDSEEEPPKNNHNITEGDNPETVRKCITLINENRELKILL